MRWCVLVAAVGLAGCFDPNDPSGSPSELGSSTSMEGTGNISSSTSSEGTTGGQPSGTGTDGNGPTNATNDPSGDTDEPPDDTGEPEACACTIATPSEWVGPLVIARGDMLPDCSGAFSGSQIDAITDISGAPATCGCSCGSGEMDCGDLSLLYRQSCGQPIGAVPYSEPDTCHDNTPAQNSTNPFLNPVEGTESCPPMPSVDLSPPTSTSVRMCGGTFSQGECGPGEACVAAIPDGFEPRLCIRRTGEHDCPPAYPQRELVFDGVSEGRDCSACECAPQGEFECSSTLQVYSDGACTDFIASVETGECVGSWSSFTFETPTVSGTCTANQPDPIGDVVGDGPTTVCCDR
jgi:hypothetical protein